MTRLDEDRGGSREREGDSERGRETQREGGRLREREGDSERGNETAGLWIFDSDPDWDFGKHASWAHGHGATEGGRGGGV